MLRELSRNEVGLVSGGTDDLPDPIIVEGLRVQYSISADDWLSIRQNATIDFSFDNFGSGGGGGAQLVDTDGDGVPDSPEIVVNALTPSQIEAANRFADDGVNILQGTLAIGTGVLFIEIGALQAAIAAMFNARMAMAVMNVASLVGSSIAVSQLRQILYEAAAIELSNGTFQQEPGLGDWDYTGPVPGRITQ